MISSAECARALKSKTDAHSPLGTTPLNSPDRGGHAIAAMVKPRQTQGYNSTNYYQSRLRQNVSNAGFSGSGDRDKEAARRAARFDQIFDELMLVALEGFYHNT